MADMTESGKDAEPGTLERLAGRGDEMLRRLVDEFEGNAKLGGAKERLEKIERSVLARVNVAAADEVDELRSRIAELELRLAKVEELAARQDAAGIA